jgi:hypothetical protein
MEDPGSALSLALGFRVVVVVTADLVYRHHLPIR